jgi:hypothetical protein
MTSTVVEGNELAEDEAKALATDEIASVTIVKSTFQSLFDHIAHNERADKTRATSTNHLKLPFS